MKNRNLKFNIIFCFLLASIVVPFFIFNTNKALANTDDFVVTPVIVDEKAKARDILKKSIKITNTSSRKLNIYLSVNNINSQEGEQAFEQARDASDRAASLANWIEISRGVIDLEPGEEKDIPFIIRVNLNAVPDNYYAQISFAQGSNRSEAEAKSGDKKMTVMVNLEVLEDIKEEMQLMKFITDKIFFSGDDVRFSYQLENIGNKEVVPEGEIRIYNRKGEEVAFIDANIGGKIIAPDKTSQLASVWSAGNGFGRYKAFLNMNYGKTQRGSIQDTVFFWVIPWKTLASVFGLLFAIVIFFAFIFHRWFEKGRLRPALVVSSATIEQAEPIPEISLSDSAVATPQHIGIPKKKKFWFFTEVKKMTASVLKKKDKRKQERATETEIRQKAQTEIESNNMHPFYKKLHQKNQEKQQVKQVERKKQTPMNCIVEYDGVINLKEFRKQKREKLACLDSVIDLRKRK